MSDQYLFSLTTSSLFDTYLIYGILVLLIAIALIGLIVLLATSCCCCYCYSSFLSCCFSCYQNHRHSSYKLRQKTKQSLRLSENETSTIAFVKRRPSDVASFAQLYDSCPHLINNKAMTKTHVNMDASCTTINTLISPLSPCSSFRSFVESDSISKGTKRRILRVIRTASISGSLPLCLSFIH